MKNIWIIVQREYLSRVKKRSFLLTTLLAPVALILLAVSGIFIESFTGTTHKVAIAGANQQLKGQLRDEEGSLTFFYPEMNEQQVKATYSQDLYDLMVVVPDLDSIKKLTQIELTYYAVNNPGILVKDKVESEIERQLSLQKLEAHQLDSNFLEEMKLQVSMKNAGSSADSFDYADLASLAGFICGILIYMTLMIYGTMILRGVMEEKQSRIVEVLMSSVKPYELLMAKIIAIGAVGLTQFSLWGILSFLVQFLLAAFLNPMSPALGSGIENMPIQSDLQQQLTEIQNGIMQLPLGWMAVAFIFYFIGGYFLYGALFAAIGSAVGDDVEGQPLILPVMLPIIIGFIISISSLNNPDNALVQFASIFPLTSAVVMPTRIAFHPPLWQLLLSVVLLLASFVAAVWVAARIYRNGILRYGKRASFTEIVKWAWKA